MANKSIKQIMQKFVIVFFRKIVSKIPNTYNGLVYMLDMGIRK